MEDAIVAVLSDQCTPRRRSSSSSIEDNSGWAEGDWDADGDFTSQDMVMAFLDGGYELGPRPASAVPEPSALGLLLVGGLLLVRRSRRSFKALC